MKPFPGEQNLVTLVFTEFSLVVGSHLKMKAKKKNYNNKIK